MISPKIVPWFHYLHTSKWSYLHFIEFIIVLWLSLSPIQSLHRWEWKGHMTFWRCRCNVQSQYNFWKGGKYVSYFALDCLVISSWRHMSHLYEGWGTYWIKYIPYYVLIIIPPTLTFIPSYISFYTLFPSIPSLILYFNDYSWRVGHKHCPMVLYTKYESPYPIYATTKNMPASSMHIYQIRV